MSYTAPAKTSETRRPSIDTLNDSWLPTHANESMAAPGSGNAIYVPLRLERRVLVYRLWYRTTNSATGNVDMALYDANGVAVIAATGASKGYSTTGAMTTFDVTDTWVGPGLFYIGISTDGSDTFGCALVPTAPMAAAYGVLVEGSAYPLPSTATWTVSQTLAMVPACGILVGTVHT